MKPDQISVRHFFTPEGPGIKTYDVRMSEVRALFLKIGEEARLHDTFNAGAEVLHKVSERVKGINISRAAQFPTDATFLPEFREQRNTYVAYASPLRGQANRLFEDLTHAAGQSNRITWDMMRPAAPKPFPCAEDVERREANFSRHFTHLQVRANGIKFSSMRRDSSLPLAKFDMPELDAPDMTFHRFG